MLSLTTLAKLTAVRQKNAVNGMQKIVNAWITIWHFFAAILLRIDAV